ncbi:MAG: hypothetical protein ACYS0I_14000 [Planctomycetota bacterium]
MKLKFISLLTIVCPFLLVGLRGLASGEVLLNSTFTIRYPTSEEEFRIIWNTLKRYYF